MKFLDFLNKDFFLLKRASGITATFSVNNSLISYTYKV